MIHMTTHPLSTHPVRTRDLLPGQAVRLGGSDRFLYAVEGATPLDTGQTFLVLRAPKGDQVTGHWTSDETMDVLDVRETFHALWEQTQDLGGLRFSIVRVITEPDDTHDEEVLPMFVLRMENGEETEAWPEEVLPNVLGPKEDRLFDPVQIMLCGNDPMEDRGIGDIPVWAVVDWADEDDPVKFVSLSERSVREYAGRVRHPLTFVDQDDDDAPHIHYSTSWRDGMGMEGPDCAATIFHLLSAYLYEVETRAESAHQRAMSRRENGDYEEAWESMDESDRLDNLHTNAKVIVDMAFGDAPRAPVFAGDDDRLLERAERIIDDIEAETDLYHEVIVDHETIEACVEYHDNL